MHSPCAGKGGGVAFYRIYQIGADDRIKGAINFECATDQEALARAREPMKMFPRRRAERAQRVAIKHVLPALTFLCVGARNAWRF